MSAARKPRLGIFAGTMIISLLLLAGCEQKRPDTLVQSAKEFIAKKDFAAAAVQLKSALQQQENGETRFLLGTALVEMGEYPAAETQLRRAKEAGYSPDAVNPLLATVLAGMGEYKKVADEFPKVTVADPAAQALITALTGEAYLALGRPEEAKRAFATARSANPLEVRARVGEARLVASGGDLAGALQLVDEVLAKSPDQAQALALRADILISQSRQDDAAVALAAWVRAAPYNGQPRFALISLLIAREKLDQAAVEISAMKKAMSRDVRRNYLEGVLAFRRGQPLQARDAVAQVLTVIPDHGPSLLLAGAAEYQLGSLSTAESYLRKVITIYPNSLYARNLLVATYLRKGQPQKAEETLGPGLKQAPKDPTILRAAGEVAFASNDFASATRFYEQALAVEKDSAGLRTRLAQIRLATGETGRGMEDLESASALDKNAYQADLSLVSAYVSQKSYDKALAAVATLEKKQPDNPLTYATKAMIYAARRNTTGDDMKNARANLEKALALQYNYLPAARILAGLDLSEKNPAAAVKRFETILARDPNNDGALLALAETQFAAKALPKDIVATLDRAIKANPSLPSARTALIKFHAQNKDPQAALAAAVAASAALPNDPSILDALGLAQLAAGETNQAIDTFNRFAALQPESPVPLMRLASAQYAAKQVDAPIQALQKALALKPDLIDAQRQLIVAQLSAGRAEDALKETRAVQKSRPKEAVGYALEGDVLANQKKHAEAANAYAEGIKRQPQPELVAKQLDVLRLAGKSAEAAAISGKWLQANPKDPVVRFYLANAAIQANDYKGAAQRYREIVALQPDNLAVMNNLAWVLNELQDPEAVTYAEKAFAIAPDNADVQDTYGWLLVVKGDTKRGIEILTKAVAAAPKAADPRLHLAKAFIKAGDKVGAKRELDVLVGLPQAGASRDEAQKLLQSL